ncbi:unnamed protein product, partial [Choristocarpus tenellus]
GKVHTVIDDNVLEKEGLVQERSTARDGLGGGEEGFEEKKEDMREKCDVHSSDGVCGVPVEGESRVLRGGPFQRNDDVEKYCSECTKVLSELENLM